MVRDEKVIWVRGYENESVHLLRGLQDIEGTEIFFIHRKDMPSYYMVIYCCLIYGI